MKITVGYHVIYSDRNENALIIFSLQWKSSNYFQFGWF